jgi:hypothetical protein
MFLLKSNASIKLRPLAYSRPLMMSVYFTRQVIQLIENVRASI